MLAEAVTGSIISLILEKGYEKSLKDKNKFRNILSKIINDSIDEFTLCCKIQTEYGVMPFYDSQVIITELLKFRFFGMDQFKVDVESIIAKANNISKVKTPTVEQISKFLEIFDKNYQKNDLIKDLEVETYFKKEIFNISDNLGYLMKEIQALTSLLEKSRNLKRGKGVNSNKVTINRINNSVYKDRLEDYKKDGNYLQAIDYITDEFTIYPSWVLMIELLKFCDLSSSPTIGLNYFDSFREILGNNPDGSDTTAQSALNYYLGRLYIQKGKYIEAFYWYSNNNKFKNYYAILSQFELASLNYRIEDYEKSLKGFEDLLNSIVGLEGIPGLKLHIYLYLSTLYVIRSIHNLPFSKSHLKVSFDPKESLSFSDLALKEIKNLRHKDEIDDKLAWVYLTFAFGEEAQSGPKLADKNYKKVDKYIKKNNIAVASEIQILIYLARYYRRLNKFDNAFDKLNQAKKISERLDRPKLEASIYFEISYLKKEQKKEKLFKDFFNRGSELFFGSSNIGRNLHWPIVERLTMLKKSILN